MRVRAPKSRFTSAISFGSVAIVTSVQRQQPPLVGVSRGRTGYGFCAYASSSAWDARMPRIHVIGETPLGVFRGDVTPPATRLCGLAALSARYAGFSRRVVYTLGEFGIRNSLTFGSFHTVQRVIHGYFVDAANANEPSASGSSG